MRAFNVHLVIDVDFEDGDEASDKTVQNYQKHLKGAIQSAPKESRSGPSRAPGSRLSWSKKTPAARQRQPQCDGHARQTRAANDAGQHARQRRPRRHGDVRSLQARGRRQRRRPA